MGNATKKKLYLCLICFMALACILVVIIGMSHREPPIQRVQTAAPAEMKTVKKYVEVEKLVEVGKEITAGTLQSGLNDMGFLITGEYYFTELMGYSSTLKDPIFHSSLKLTESNYLASYDGVVTAGIDFAGITVEQNPKTLTMTVYLPKASIQNVDIDPESFKLYSEKTSMFNPISVVDFNETQIELEHAAREKAVDKGLLARADENAKTVVANFIRSMLEPGSYALEFVTV